MGISEKLSGGRRPRRGLAIPAALFALVIVSALTTAIFLLADIQGRAVRNRESNARAFLLAEEGLTHALTVVRDTLRNKPYSLLLRGSDGAIATADDGLLIGYGMSGTISIPAAGKVTAAGTYTVQFVDDPADPDGNALEDQNGRILARCMSVWMIAGAVGRSQMAHAEKVLAKLSTTDSRRAGCSASAATTMSWTDWNAQRSGQSTE